MKIATVVFAFEFMGAGVAAHAMSRTYDYILSDDVSAEPGDLAIVDSPVSGIAPVLIVGIQEKSIKATKHVIDIISLAPLRTARAKADREKAVRKVLEEKLKQRIEDNKYAVLMDDPEARALMQEIGIG